MATQASIHVGDVGTAFVDVLTDEDGAVVNLSAATAKKFSIGPVGTATAWLDAAFDTDGTDGALKYVSTAGLLGTTNADAGTWSYQFYVEVGSSKFYGDAHGFKLKENRSQVS